MSVPRPRPEKIKALLPTVQADDDGSFWVESLSLKGWQYRVTPKTPDAPAKCQCEDYQRKGTLHAGYRCIHLEAVRAFVIAKRKEAREATGSLTQLPKPPSIAQNLFSMELHLRRVAQRQAYLREQPPKGLAFW